MKLCVIATVALTCRYYLIDQLVFLSKKGFDVTFVCNNDPEFAKDCPPEIRYVPLSLKRNANPLSTLKSIYKLYVFFKTGNFDIIQYCTPKASFVSSFAGYMAHVPVRLYCQWGIRYVSFSGLTRSFFKFFELMTCVLSTHISPDSNGNRLFSIEEGLYSADKSSVVLHGSANGVDLERFNVKKKNMWRKEIHDELKIENSVVFGWIGRLCRDKGINELIEAFNSIVSEGHKVNLLLVGPEEKKHGVSENIMHLIRTHPCIKYMGAREDVERIYAAMDVLVSPSYREGFGITAIEAQAMEVPVILSDIPGPREALEKGTTGLLVPPRSSEALKKAMGFMLYNENRRLSMGKAGRNFVEANFEQNTFWKAVYEHRRSLLFHDNESLED